MTQNINFSNHEIEEDEFSSLDIEERKLLVTWNDPASFVNKLRNYSSISSIQRELRKVGGYRMLYCMLEDPEIMAALRKRQGGIRNIKIEFDIDSPYQDEIMSFIRPNLDCIKKESIWASFFGYNVHEIRWVEQGRLFFPVELRLMPFYYFKPSSDLKNVYYSFYALKEQSLKDQAYANYGKYILTSNMGTFERPYGRGLAYELFYVWDFKKHVMGFWAKWLEKFGSGFLDITVENGDDSQLKKVKESFAKAVRGSAIAHTDAIDLDVLYPQGDGSHFQNFQESILETYHRAILGEVLTSSDASSRAAAETHNDIRREIIENDLDHCENVVNRMIEYFFTVNNLPIEQRPMVKISVEKGLRAERALRDETVTRIADVKFSKEYLIDSYGYKEDDLVDVEPAPSLFSGSTSETFENDSMSLEDKAEFEFVTKAERKRNNTLDEIEEFLNRSGGDVVDFRELRTAIDTAKNEKELMTNLSFVLEKGSESYDEIFTRAILYAMSKGMDSTDDAKEE